jgi:hypothetical protein
MKNWADLRCHHCGEPIGVYEPLVTLVDGHEHETSRLAEPHAASVFSACYHRECFDTGSDSRGLLE